MLFSRSDSIRSCVQSVGPSVPSYFFRLTRSDICRVHTASFKVYPNYHLKFRILSMGMSEASRLSFEQRRTKPCRETGRTCRFKPDSRHNSFDRRHSNIAEITPLLNFKTWTSGSQFLHRAHLRAARGTNKQFRPRKSVRNT